MALDDTDLSSFEAQVERLLTARQTLVSENKTLRQQISSLRQQLSKLTQERAQQWHNLQQATTKIKNLVKRLRENLS